MVKSKNPSAPVPLQQGHKLPLPPVSAAMGMAAAYYGYPLLNSLARQGGWFLFGAFLLLLVILISLLRVLVYPFAEAPLGKISSGPESPERKVPAFVRKAGMLTVAASVGFTLGIAARQTVRDRTELGLPAERVTAVSGILGEDPRSLVSGSGMALMELRSCSAPGGLRATARGNITVFFPEESIPRLKEFGRGSEVYLDGVFSRGERGSMFNARSVHIVKPAPALESFRTLLRTTLITKFQNRQGSSAAGSGGGSSNALSRGEAPVWGSLASALILGVRDDLDTDLTRGFLYSGCAHVLALSGMHLAILSGILAFLLRRPLGTRWASLAGAVFIVVYVFVAGSQPSLVRAAIMYLIAALALWYQLKGRALSLLGMAFIIQLLFQSQTGITLSFILSYLALAGILTLGVTLRALFRGRLPEIINDSLSASLGAFIITAPVVVFYFGTLRPVGIIAGLIVVPLSSLFMVVSLAALVAAFLPLPVWNFFDLILTGLYRFLEFLVTLAGQVPGFDVSNPLPVLAVSILIWVLILFIKKQDDLKRSSIAPFD